MTKIAEGPQRVSSKSVGEKRVTYNSDDLEAAKCLARVAVDALKLGFGPPSKVTVKTGKGSIVGGLDLWDVAGPWKLKTPGA